ncbi:MAG: hypothetical protein ACYS17_15530 [Planctomycetota bacterium]|jgi:hypothetical protein
MDIFVTLITVLSAIMGIILGVFKLRDRYKNNGRKEPATSLRVRDRYKNNGRKEPATSLRAEPRGNLTLDEIENILINKFQNYAGGQKIL